EDTYQSYGYGWANASNTPFRLYKQHDHEGGINVPLIARWPAVIEPGGMTDQLAHVIDLMPTFVDAAGLQQPSEFQQRAVHSPDGRSLRPVFEGNSRAPASELYWKWSRGRAIRQGQWKLVAVRERPWELYDIERDGTELHDLAADHPDRVSKMAQLWDKWAAGPPPLS
ncbi:MAG: sulfatase-like hydrolase/transferase, partial [Acidobacteriia bacterium]|nr:sulfatase-like hydrolase/transferase [Terriglobia bacterium]